MNGLFRFPLPFVPPIFQGHSSKLKKGNSITTAWIGTLNGRSVPPLTRFNTVQQQQKAGFYLFSLLHTASSKVSEKVS
jgi:hypothetical protein